MQEKVCPACAAEGNSTPQPIGNFVRYRSTAKGPYWSAYCRKHERARLARNYRRRYARLLDGAPNPDYDAKAHEARRLYEQARRLKLKPLLPDGAPNPDYDAEAHEAQKRYQRERYQRKKK